MIQDMEVDRIESWKCIEWRRGSVSNCQFKSLNLTPCRSVKWNWWMISINQSIASKSYSFFTGCTLLCVNFVIIIRNNCVFLRYGLILERFTQNYYVMVTGGQGVLNVFRHSIALAIHPDTAQHHHDVQTAFVRRGIGHVRGEAPIRLRWTAARPRSTVRDAVITGRGRRGPRYRGCEVGRNCQLLWWAGTCPHAVRRLYNFGWKKMKFLLLLFALWKNCTNRRQLLSKTEWVSLWSQEFRSLLGQK